MREVLFITDTHLKKDNFELVYSIFEQACVVCQERGIKTILHGGDIFTVRAGLSLEVLVNFIKIMKMVKKYNIQLIAIPGNHDKTNLSSEQSYLDVFKSWGLEVIKTHQVLDFKFGKTIVHFLPYFPEDTIYKEALNELVENIQANDSLSNRVLLTHISISGVKNNDGTAVSNKLKKDLFSAFDLVLVGHYHNRSRIGKNIHYIGSAMPQNFGEDNDKGFVVLNEDLEMTFIKAKFPQYITEFFHAEDDGFKKAIEAGLKKYKNSKDFIRFKITGESETLEKFDKSRFLEVGIQIVFDNIHIIRNIEAVGESGKIKYSNASLLTEYFAYCKEVEATREQTKIGLKYFREAINVSNKNS